VFVGWWNVITNNQTEEARKRYEICMQCDKKKKIGKNNYICSICGCVLKAKAASPEEKCDLNKW